MQPVDDVGLGPWARSFCLICLPSRQQDEKQGNGAVFGILIAELPKADMAGG
jgi:hypothetical protein